MTRVNDPTVRVSGGELVGLDRNGVSVFKGIRYATAARFEASLPDRETWSNRRDATMYGPQAPQVPGTMERLLGESSQPTDENCLTLNVFAPDHTGPHPVIVWIHGGAFTNGAGSVPWYDGTNMARLHDVVVVTVNYRLGAFGFLGDANLGIGDQIEALRWVRDEIAAFGGDPHRVTIMGESAGGSSVITLMAAPDARNLFRAAIALSPSMPQIRNRARAEATVGELLAAAAVDDVDALRRLSVDELLAAQSIVLGSTDDALTAFSPSDDGAFVPASVIDAASRDPRPLMIGTTRDEMHLFTAFDPAVTGMDESTLERRFGTIWSDPRSAIDVYRSLRDDHDVGQLFSAMRTDAVFRRPAHDLADARAAHGHRSFMHWFAFPTPVFGGVLGSCHALDIPFALSNLDRKGVEIFTGDDTRRADLADEFSTAVASFTADLEPGWPAWDERRSVQRLDLTSRIGDDILEDPEAPIRELWSGANAH